MLESSSCWKRYSPSDARNNKNKSYTNHNLEITMNSINCLPFVTIINFFTNYHYIVRIIIIIVNVNHVMQKDLESKSQVLYVSKQTYTQTFMKHKLQYENRKIYQRKYWCSFNFQTEHGKTILLLYYSKLYRRVATGILPFDIGS